MLKDCARITWENALLGDSMIKKLRAKGTALEQEHAEAVEKLKQEAVKHKEAEEKAEKMGVEAQEHLQRVQSAEEKLLLSQVEVANMQAAEAKAREDLAAAAAQRLALSQDAERLEQVRREDEGGRYGEEKREERQMARRSGRRETARRWR
jgi:hypothetical protein